MPWPIQLIENPPQRVLRCPNAASFTAPEGGGGTRRTETWRGAPDRLTHRTLPTRRRAGWFPALSTVVAFSSPDAEHAASLMVSDNWLGHSRRNRPRCGRKGPVLL